MNEALLRLEEPADYFKGRGHAELPVPQNLLLFLRTEKKKLQQEALQNRSHHRFVLAVNLKTEGYIHADHLALPFRPGQALLILPFQFHHFSLQKSPHLKWLFCTFELQPRTFLETLRNRVVDIGEKSTGALEELLNEWHQPHSELQAEQLQAHLLHLLLSLKQDRQYSSVDLPPEPEHDLLRAVNRFMDERRGRTAGVADLAGELDFSASRLRVLFKQAAGIPLGAYMQNYRLNLAMSLLRTTGLSIKNVAEEAGFGSLPAFSRTFKRETGQTPRWYRAGS